MRLWLRLEDGFRLRLGFGSGRCACFRVALRVHVMTLSPMVVFGFSSVVLMPVVVFLGVGAIPATAFVAVILACAVRLVVAHVLARVMW